MKQLNLFEWRSMPKYYYHDPFIHYLLFWTTGPDGKLLDVPRRYSR